MQKLGVLAALLCACSNGSKTPSVDDASIAPNDDASGTTQEDQAIADTSDGGSTDDLSLATLSAPTFTCGKASAGAAPATGTNLIEATTVGMTGNTYPQGAVTLAFITRATAADTVAWTVQDAWQKTVAQGSFAVGASPTTTNVVCTSTLAGYFAITAKLMTNGASLPLVGTRPAGIATFGVLPDVTPVLPKVTYAHVDDHRFGMQAGAYIVNGDGYVPFAPNLGVTIATQGRTWAQLEPNSSGQFDPSTYVPSPSDAQNVKDGMSTYWDVSKLPGWANSSGTASAQYPPLSFPTYQTFMSKLGTYESNALKTYKTAQHNYYQVTWEPNPGTGNAWKGTTADFINLYKAAYTGLHSTDSSAVVLGITCDSPEANITMLPTMLSAGLIDYVDAFSYHGYYAAPDTWTNPPEDTGGTSLPDQLRALHHIFATTSKPHAKVFQTEMGIRYPESATDYSAANLPTATELAEQGAVVARAHIIHIGEGADVDMFFYPGDFPGDTGSGLNFNLNAGDANPYGSGNISPKPGFMEGAALTRMLDGTITLGYFNNLPSGVYGYAFQQYDGGAVVSVLWTHNTAWNATATYALLIDDATKSDTIAIVDSMGNPSTIAEASGKVSLTLGEYPVYVISNNAAVTKALVTVPEGYQPTQ